MTIEIEDGHIIIENYLIPRPSDEIMALAKEIKRMQEGEFNVPHNVRAVNVDFSEAETPSDIGRIMVEALGPDYSFKDEGGVLSFYCKGKPVPIEYPAELGDISKPDWGSKL